MLKTAILIFTGLTLSTGLWSQNRISCDQGQVNFTSDAPLELIKASSSSLKGVIDTDNKTFAYTLLVRTFKGFNSPLQQEHFYENYLHTSEFAQATFQGKIIEDVDFNLAGRQKIRVKGVLDIHGIKQERIIPCELQIEEDQVLVSSAFYIPLKDHNISIPKIVHQKIAEEILVEIKARFSK